MTGQSLLQRHAGYTASWGVREFESHRLVVTLFGTQ